MTGIDQGEALAALAAKLTKAQREVLLRCDHRVWSMSEIHHRTFAALFNAGIAAKLLAAGHSFFNWTPLGLALREHIQSNMEGER